MQADISPQPDDGVRQALLVALAAQRDTDDRGPWWRTGLEETPDDEPPPTPPVPRAKLAGLR